VNIGLVGCQPKAQPQAFRWAIGGIEGFLQHEYAVVELGLPEVAMRLMD